MDASQIIAARNFLRDFKKNAQDKGIDFIPRRENLQSLACLGLTIRTAKIEILSLSVENYSDGPCADRDKPGDVWIFGTHINDREVYIKLKIADTGSGGKIAKCLSFHAADYSLSYPFKKGGKCDEEDMS